MKLFKVQKTDLNHDGEYYNEGEVSEFDEKSKSVKKLVEAGILVEAKAKAEKKEEDKTKADDDVNKLLEERGVKLLELGYTFKKKEKAYVHPVLTDNDPVSLIDLERISEEDFNAALELTKEQLKLIEADKK